MCLPHTWFSRVLKYNGTYSTFSIYQNTTQFPFKYILELTFLIQTQKGLKSKEGSLNNKGGCGLSRACPLRPECAPFAFFFMQCYTSLS